MSGRIQIPEDTGEGFRLSDGETVVTRRAYETYGKEFLEHLFPHSTIHVAEDLLASMEDGDQDAPETPGGQP